MKAAVVHSFDRPLVIDDVPVPERRTDAALRRCINAVVKEVASGLRNTPAVCRKSYINPAVFVAWQNGKLRRRAAHGRPMKRPVNRLIALLGRA